jgi:hypothetical protein
MLYYTSSRSAGEEYPCEHEHELQLRHLEASAGGVGKQHPGSPHKGGVLLQAARPRAQALSVWLLGARSPRAESAATVPRAQPRRLQCRLAPPMPTTAPPYRTPRLPYPEVREPR